MAVIPWPLNPASVARPGAAPPRKAAAPPDDVAAAASTLIQSRQTILPKRLGTPGPAGDELEQILGAAAHAPDHGQLMPWRFVLVPAGARGSLADVFAQALLERAEADRPMLQFPHDAKVPSAPEQVERGHERSTGTRTAYRRPGPGHCHGSSRPS